MHFRDLLGMLLLRYSGISLLILPIAALSLSLTFRYFLPWYVSAVVIVISLIISESMMRSLTDLLLPGQERTWTLWLIAASNKRTDAKNSLDSIPASEDFKAFLIRMKRVPTLSVVAKETLANLK